MTMIPEMPASKPIVFNEEKCIGCNKCVEICQVDIFVPNPDKNKNAPLILYPGECWYCGSCVVVCPVEGAIELRHPLMNQVHWIEKSRLK
ncbi:MAG: 4Fe-4S dicluster domain-containing protein [Bacteroidales bacterium]